MAGRLVSCRSAVEASIVYTLVEPSCTTATGFVPGFTGGVP
jgi:hypothetical protein